MNDPLQALLEAGVVPSSAHPLSSRYHGVATRTHDGIVYLSRRLIAAPERFATTGEIVVEQGDRADLLAARHLGDPQLYWRLCDANEVLAVRELEVLGRRVRITLPEGIPGPPHA